MAILNIKKLIYFFYSECQLSAWSLYHVLTMAALLLCKNKRVAKKSESNLETSIFWVFDVNCSTSTRAHCGRNGSRSWSCDSRSTPKHED